MEKGKTEKIIERILTLLQFLGLIFMVIYSENIRNFIRVIILKIFPFRSEFIPAFLGAILMLSVLMLYLYAIFRTKLRLDVAHMIKKLHEQSNREPGKIKPAWDLAQITLDGYFNRNLRHINAIFWLSVVVMVAGFGVIIWGVGQSLQTPDAAATSWITMAAGVVTEFIGATFILIYRSTLTQAQDYAKALERINSVGMAMQILDTMSDEATSDNLKSKTKATLAELLIQNQKFTVLEQNKDNIM